MCVGGEGLWQGPVLPSSSGAKQVLAHTVTSVSAGPSIGPAALSAWCRMPRLPSTCAAGLHPLLWAQRALPVPPEDTQPQLLWVFLTLCCHCWCWLLSAVAGCGDRAAG